MLYGYMLFKRYSTNWTAATVELEPEEGSNNITQPSIHTQKIKPFPNATCTEKGLAVICRETVTFIYWYIMMKMLPIRKNNIQTRSRNRPVSSSCLFHCSLRSWVILMLPQLCITENLSTFTFKTFSVSMALDESSKGSWHPERKYYLISFLYG